MLKEKLHNIIPLVLAVGIFMIHVLGTFLPDIFWSTHFLAFTPSFFKYGLLIVVFFIGFLAYNNKTKNINYNYHLNKSSIIIITLIAAVIFYNLEIVNDYYGDAKNFKPHLNSKFTGFTSEFWQKLFSIEFKTGHARWGVFNFYSLIAYALNINMHQTFKLMNTVFGAGFFFIWLTTIRNYTTTKVNTFILTIIGCTAPVVLIFCGHIEIYSFILFLLISWMYLLTKYFKENKTWCLWVLIPLSVICIRFNTPSILLLPALILTFVYHYGKIPSFFTLKNLFRYILIPLFILGVIAYFFIFKDYNDLRTLNTGTKDIDRLFLPIFSPPAPLDTYNLLSWNHISDFLMSTFFWSSGLLFLIGIIIINRKKTTWDTPLTNILLLTLVLFSGFLFMINPLMSLPMDWDLYTLPFPILLMLLLLFLEQQQTVFINRKIITFTLGLQLLSIPTFIVLMNKKMHSHRIESVGVRVYKTYYLHSDSYLLYALQMDDDYDNYTLRKQQLLQKLKPYVRDSIDQNYAALLLDDAINTYAEKKYQKSRAFLLAAESHAPYLKLTREYLIKVNDELIKQNFKVPKKEIKVADSLTAIGLKKYREEKQFNDAISFLQRASYYDPLNPQIRVFIMEAYFLKQNYKKAFLEAERLTALKFPNEQQALRFAIHCAIEAEEYKKAEKYANEYLSILPNDAFIKSIYNNLKKNENLSDLKYKFAKTTN